MSYQQIVIHHSGHWERLEYIGGDWIMVYMPVDNLSRSNLIEEIHDQVGGDEIANYLLFYITRMEDGQKIKVSLKTDADLFRLFMEQKERSVVYVIENGEKGKRSADNGGVYRSQRSTVVSEANLRASSSAADDELVFSDEEEDDNQHKELFESLVDGFRSWIRQPGHIDRFTGQHNFSSDHHQSSSEAHNATRAELGNWVIPLIDFDTALPLDWGEPCVAGSEQLLVGSIFKSKYDLTIAVGLYHMENLVEYKVPQSDKQRWILACKHSTQCLFKLRAVQKGSIWRINKFSTHTCQMELDQTARRRVPAKILGTYFKRKLKIEKMKLKPKEMMAEMLTNYGIDIDYNFALRARNIAIELTYGDFHKSFQQLPSYLYLLRKRNIGTVYDIETKSNGEFHHMFLALGQSIHAFNQEYLRLVIIVDGTHLKGKNHGILFVVVTQDGDEHVFPLAIGIGPIENDESWTWFLSRVRLCLGMRDDLFFVSDQHLSIKNAIESVYPNTPHGFCYFHLKKNLLPYGKHVGDIFKEAAYAYRDVVVQDNMSILKAINKDGAHKRLSEIGIERWAKCKCPVRRFGFLTSNVVECLNVCLSWARRLPICALLESYRNRVEIWFDERRLSNVNRDHPLTDGVGKKIFTSMEWGRRLNVRGTTTHMYKVEGDNNIPYLVDLENSTCECREFQLDLIPCRHACAAIRFAGFSIYDFVSSYFKQEVFLQCYAPHIESLPHPHSWFVPPHVSAFIVHPPVIESKVGRLKTNRN